MAFDEFVIFWRFHGQIPVSVSGMIYDIIDYIPQWKILKIGDTVEINGREVPYLYWTQKVPSNYVRSEYCQDEQMQKSTEENQNQDEVSISEKEDQEENEKLLSEDEQMQESTEENQDQDEVSISEKEDQEESEKLL